MLWTTSDNTSWDTHLKGKDDFPQEAQGLLSVSIHNVSGINGGAWK